jgi:predicted RNA-binding Zn-ribbon protein involved in translation (DUF1610 family)
MPKDYAFAAQRDPGPKAQSPKPKPDPDADTHVLTCPKCGAQFIEREGMPEDESPEEDTAGEE